MKQTKRILTLALAFVLALGLAAPALAAGSSPDIAACIQNTKEILESDHYTMRAQLVGGGISGTVTSTRDGANSATEFSFGSFRNAGEFLPWLMMRLFIGRSFRFVTKGGHSFLILPDYRSYYTGDDSDAFFSVWKDAYAQGMSMDPLPAQLRSGNYQSGAATLDGKPCLYAKFREDGSEQTYYFVDGALRRIESKRDDGAETIESFEIFRAGSEQSLFQVDGLHKSPFLWFVSRVLFPLVK